MFIQFLEAKMKHRMQVYKAIFSNNGEMILTGSFDNTAKLWDLKGKLLSTVKNTGTIRFISFSPDDTKILTSTFSNTTKIWDLSGNLLFECDHESYVRRNANFLKNRINNPVYTNKIWDLKGNRIATLYDELYINAPTFSEDGNWVITTAYPSTKIHSHYMNILSLEFANDVNIRSVYLSKEASYYLIGIGERKLQLVDLQGKTISEYRHEDFINTVEFSPDGKWILTASNDKTAKIWNLTGESCATFRHLAPVNSAVFSPDGFRVLTASKDRSAKLWI
jgi:WD40 repeat protein